MNFLERTLATFSPARAVRRAEARARLARVEAIKNLYDGAASGRRTEHWRRAPTDANTEVGAAAQKIRGIARDMVRNNAHAEHAKSVIRNNVVGAGITPRIETTNESKKAAIVAHLESTDVDADGVLTIYGIQALVVATVVEAGECLVRYRPRLSTDGLALPFQLQVLEPDYLDNARTGPISNGNFCVQGIEFDLRGKRVAYWLFNQHPGGTGWGQGLLQSQRVSADFVAHIYRVDRPGQVRGMSWFAPVIVRMRDFADYVDAQGMRQKIAACFAAFITTSEGASVDPVSGSDTPIEVFEPGMIERLREGESVQFANPPSTADFDPYTKTTLREIAAGLGVTYEAMTGDLSGTNYSSGRLGWLEFSRSIDSWRWNMVIPQFCHRVANWSAFAAGVVSSDTSPMKISWTPPRRAMIDPQVEIAAAKDAIRSGLTSRSEEVRATGFDPVDLDNEIAADNARADALKLIFDTDPRLVTTRGVGQKGADPAAPDSQGF